MKEPGDYFTTQIIGEPIVVARARDGEIAAMSAVCQHRAMLVAEGHGNARGLVCPYHHWVYGLDGKLVNAPAMERTCDFDKKAVRLPELQGRDLAGLHLHQFRSRTPRRWRRAWRSVAEAIAPLRPRQRRERRRP